MAELHEHGNDSATDSGSLHNATEAPTDALSGETGEAGIPSADTNGSDAFDASLKDLLDGELESGSSENPVQGASDQIAELTNDLQRLTAEYANFRRRTARERADLAESVKSVVLTELLPLADDLDLAEQHGDLDQEPLKSIAGKIRAIFSSNKVEPFGKPGDEFNPEIHEAIQDEGGDGTKIIAMVYRKGYYQNAKVLRTAMVTVRGSESTGE